MNKKTLSDAIKREGVEEVARDTGYSIAMLNSVRYGVKELGMEGARKVGERVGVCPCCFQTNRRKRQA